ncbi:hypothetical protein KIN20_029389 [Parelaphostrongylus tenuis]|uniref:Uncharacterized protein n=1 Tax=Parelaphostrongylus tenuis TaxID=148309 RepID=A0AAD5R2C4_PARTN|nr:hypothetical protein KIN20_029389 [Parelaphostrongylus tenuis]
MRRGVNWPTYRKSSREQWVKGVEVADSVVAKCALLYTRDLYFNPVSWDVQHDSNLAHSPGFSPLRGSSLTLWERQVQSTRFAPLRARCRPMLVYFEHAEEANLNPSIQTFHHLRMRMVDFNHGHVASSYE